LFERSASFALKLVNTSKLSTQFSTESFRFDKPSQTDCEEIIGLFLDSRQAGLRYPSEIIAANRDSIYAWLCSGPVTDRWIVQTKSSIISYIEFENLSIYNSTNEESALKPEMIADRTAYWNKAFNGYQGDIYNDLTVIKRFVVKPEYHRLGIGNKFFRFACEQISCQKQNSKPALVVLNHLQKAIKLYDSLGSSVGEFKGYDDSAMLTAYVFD
jgi:ribosomal protein S18 acetylase RimI-like enzyme